MKHRFFLIFFLVLFLAIAIVIILDVFINNIEVYDFVANFHKAEKIGFYKPAYLNYLMPPLKYNWKNGKYSKFRQTLLKLYKKHSDIIASDTKSYSENLGPILRGLFRLSFQNNDRNVKFKFKIFYNLSERHLQFTVIQGKNPHIIIDNIINNKIYKVVSIPLSLNTIHKYGLNFLFLQHHIFIFDDTNLRFIWKDEHPVKDEEFRFSLLNTDFDTKYVFKYTELKYIDEKKIAENIHLLPSFPKNHAFQYMQVAKPWNDLYPEYHLNLNGVNDPYLHRLKLGSDTMPVIIIPEGARVRYKVSIPEGGKLEFFLTLPPEIINNFNNTEFKVSIYKSNALLLKEFEIKQILSSEIYTGFVPVKIDLSEFSGKNYLLEFKYEKKNHKISTHAKSFICMASPLLYTVNQKNEPNIILISLDTLRADHLGCYGYHRDTTPNIDKFAQKGTIFLNTISGSPWTLPSHISLFTSRYPYETGFQQNTSSLSSDWYFDTRIAYEIKTLAEYLKDKGYRTAGMTGGSYLSTFYRFDRGFDYYHEKPYYKDKDAAEEVTRAISWIKGNKTSKFFLFFHTYEIHEPYTRNYFCKTKSQNKSTDVKNMIISKYDSGIKYTDEHIGRIFDELEATGLLQKTIVIITSDHGENFDKLKTDDFGTWGSHGSTLYDVELKVPLIIGGHPYFCTGKRKTEQVSLLDIFPTIMDIIGEEGDISVRGRSILPSIKGNKIKETVAYAEGLFMTKAEGLFMTKYDKKALRTNRYKFILDTSPIDKSMQNNYDKYEYYNLTKDPLETTNITLKNLQQIKILEKHLKRITSSILSNYTKLHIHKRSISIDTKDLEKQLKQLGYIN